MARTKGSITEIEVTNSIAAGSRSVYVADVIWDNLFYKKSFGHVSMYVSKYVCM